MARSARVEFSKHIQADFLDIFIEILPGILFLPVKGGGGEKGRRLKCTERRRGGIQSLLSMLLAVRSDKWFQKQNLSAC